MDRGHNLEERRLQRVPVRASNHQHHRRDQPPRSSGRSSRYTPILLKVPTRSTHTDAEGGPKFMSRPHRSKVSCGACPAETEDVLADRGSQPRTASWLSSYPQPRSRNVVPGWTPHPLVPSDDVHAAPTASTQLRRRPRSSLRHCSPPRPPPRLPRPPLSPSYAPETTPPSPSATRCSPARCPLRPRRSPASSPRSTRRPRRPPAPPAPASPSPTAPSRSPAP